MAISAQDILDLNGSMEAARNFGDGLGTEVNTLKNHNVVTSGSVTPTDGDREVVDSGLSAVTFAVVSLSGSPSADHSISTITAGSVAGMLVIQSWAALGVGNENFTSASTGWAKVEWLATGTA